MAQRILTAQINRPDGEPWAGGVVDFTLLDDTYTLSPDASYPQRTVRAVTNAAGEMTVTLAGGLDATWQVTMPDGETFSMLVGDGPTTTLETLRAAYTALVPEPPFDVQGFLASLVITDGAQPSDADLTAIADLAPSNDDFIQRKAGAWTNRTVAQVKSDLLEFASTAETTTGTNAAKAVTPDGLHDMTSLAGAAWFLDEDTMSSDSATKVPSQQSVKAYVNAGKVELLSSNTTSSSTIASTASEAAFDRACTVGANTLAVGDVLRVVAWGLGTAHSSGTLTVQLRVRWGGLAGVVIDSSPVITLSASLAYVWSIELRVIVRDIGGSGGFVWLGTNRLENFSSGALVSETNSSSGATVATNTSNDIVVTALHGAAHASNAIVLYGLVVERLRT